MPKYSDGLLTPKEADLVIGAIPLQALPEPWYVGDWRQVSRDGGGLLRSV